jgi:maltoporin
MRYAVKWLFVSLVFTLTGATASAYELDFGGYFRHTLALSGTGGGQVCFALANADSKFRLGNECDTVIEPVFTFHLVRMGKDHPWGADSDWGFVVMPSAFRTYQKEPVKGYGDFAPTIGQVYFYGANVPLLAHGKIWAGRRQYDRLQLGLNDQFIENEDGDGAGIEDMKVGDAKWSVAWLLNPNAGDGQNVKPYKLTTRIIYPTLEKSDIELWLGMYSRSVTDDQSLGPNPPQVNVGHPRYRMGLYNKLHFEAIKGDNLAGVKIETSKVHQLWRAFAQQNATIPELKTTFEVLGEYRSQKNRTDDAGNVGDRFAWGHTQNWLAVGARSDTQIYGPARFLVDLGHDQTMEKGADTQRLDKVTVAAAISAGDESGSRPTFRLFYTYAMWNKAAQGANGVYDSGHAGAMLKSAYGNKTSGSTFGIQGEGWW